jgi:hypothetical protein
MESIAADIGQLAGWWKLAHVGIGCNRLINRTNSGEHGQCHCQAKTDSTKPAQRTMPPAASRAALLRAEVLAPDVA